MALKKALDENGARIPLLNQQLVRTFNPQTQQFPVLTKDRRPSTVSSDTAAEEGSTDSAATTENRKDS